MSLNIWIKKTHVLLFSVIAQATAVYANEPLIDCKLNPTVSTKAAFFSAENIENNPELQFIEWKFSSCRNTEFYGYDIYPHGKKNLPAILYVHWFDPREADSNPHEFLTEAIAMAKKGVRTLLITTLWTEPNADYHKRRWQDDLQTTKAQTQDLLNAIDFLREQNNVDQQKIAYIGHDYGGTFGSLVVSQRPWLSGAILMTTVPRFNDWYLYGSSTGVPEGEEREQYISSFKSLNPIEQLKKNRVPLLLQFADHDEFISAAQALEVEKSAGNKATSLHYDDQHPLRTPKASEDRIQWISKLLKLNSMQAP